MNTKRIVIVAVIALVVIASLAVAGLAVAQTPTPPAPFGYGYGPGLMYGQGYGRGRRGNGGVMMPGYERGGGPMMQNGGYGPMHDEMIAALAGKLNLTPEELQTRIASGETPAQIAAAQGLSAQDFFTLMTEARQEALEKAVADGKLTQEQADWMSAHMNAGHMGGAGRGFGNCPYVTGTATP